MVAASDPRTLELLARVYGAVIPAGIHRAPSIRVAEAAKVIENVQRDVNIALMNELAMLLRRLGIESREVLAAAATKWNFHPYEPGLVGGHCISVDPYYLAYKARAAGHNPAIILAGREVNDGMARWVCADLLNAMLDRGIRPAGARVLVAGFTFKEDCPDVRNSKVADLARALAAEVAEVVLWDPLASPEEVRREYGLELLNEAPPAGFEAAIVAVRHRALREAGAAALRALLVPGGLIYDLKRCFPAEHSDVRL